MRDAGTSEESALAQRHAEVQRSLGYKALAFYVNFWVVIILLVSALGGVFMFRLIFGLYR